MGFIQKAIGAGKKLSPALMLSQSNLFNGTNRCKNRMESWYSGDPALMQAGKEACKGGDPGKYSNSSVFLKEYNQANQYGIAETTQDTQQAIEQRTKAIKVTLISLAVLVVIILVVRWINKK